MRIDRMLSITVMLLNRDRVSARELAEKFEVSVRTIYRDIEAINMAGIPVVSYSGNNGGFGIMENYRIDRQLLTLNDMQSILTALKGVNTALDDLGIDIAIEKISNLVPEEKTQEINRRLEHIVIDILPWGYPGKYKKYLNKIQESIENNTLLEVNYRNTKGEYSSRIIEPMTLILQGYTWYVFAYCRLKNAYRIFRISRIAGIMCMPEKFIRRDESYKNYIKWNQTDLDPVNLVLKFTPEARARVEDFFDEERINFQDNGDMIVKVSFPEDEWVYSTILSYGDYVEVLAPAHIRKIIREKVKKITAKYKHDIKVSQA